MTLPDKLPVFYAAHLSSYSSRANLGQSALLYFSEKLKELTARQLYFTVISQINVLSERAVESPVAKTLEGLGLLYKIQALRLLLRPLCTSNIKGTSLTNAAKVYYKLTPSRAKEVEVGNGYYNTLLYYSERNLAINPEPDNPEFIDKLCVSAYRNFWAQLGGDMYKNPNERLCSYLANYYFVSLRMARDVAAQKTYENSFIETTLSNLRLHERYIKEHLQSVSSWFLEAEYLFYFRLLLSEAPTSFYKLTSEVWSKNVEDILPLALANFGAPGLLAVTCSEIYFLIAALIDSLESNTKQISLLSLKNSFIDTAESQELVSLLKNCYELTSFLTIFGTYKEFRDYRFALFKDLGFFMDTENLSYESLYANHLDDLLTALNKN